MHKREPFQPPTIRKYAMLCQSHGRVWVKPPVRLLLYKATQLRYFSCSFELGQTWTGPAVLPLEQDTSTRLRSSCSGDSGTRQAWMNSMKTRLNSQKKTVVHACETTSDTKSFSKSPKNMKIWSLCFVPFSSILAKKAFDIHLKLAGEQDNCRTKHVCLPETFQTNVCFFSCLTT